MTKLLRASVRGALLTGALFAAYGGQQAFALTIDDFSVLQAEVDTDPVTAAGPSNSVAVNGGQRALSVTKASGTNNVRASVKDPGELNFSVDANTDGNGDVDWTGINLNLSSEESIVVTIVEQDHPNVGLTLTVNGASQTKTSTSAVFGTPTNIVFPLSGFAGVNASAVTSLKLDIDGVADLDMRIDGISTVAGAPPPAIPGITMAGLVSALLGLPLIAGFFASRRRRA